MKIKTFISFLFILVCIQNIHAQEKPKSVALILKEAKQQATIENKNVFVMFTASWCGWCKKMKATMETPSVEKLFNTNYVIKYITVLEHKTKKQLENPGSKELLNKYGGKNNGIPFYLIFDSDGNLLADSKMVSNKNVLKGEGTNIGCPSTNEEIDAFAYKLKETSNLTDKELIAIAAEFKKE
ncbi:Thioredoxin-like [Lutibacter agarilyticus]|uniref:Thioredoxin-like n=1 Tax=Lutibacter agarilyticus TaxID=1109740 RepID=A0A238WE81_9FLAO|nr:thioredoxin family protein [Lutibacter agarilyticus]SNR44583.1 Thioredoxin-like [Lutibacter agarilyticus]